MRIIPLEKSTVESNEPPLTDAIRKLLEGVKPAGSGVSTMSVPLATLEALAEKVRLLVWLMKDLEPSS